LPGPLGSPESFEAKLARSGRVPDPRRDLLHYLAGEFASGEPMRIAGSEPDATGRSLTDRMVSRLEVLTALRRLPYRQRRVIELRFRDGRSVQDVCGRLRIGKTAYYRYQEDAVETMVAAIYEWSATEVA
jgi:DNA-directed RNA polymerase specialized sigma subunit